MTRYTLTLDYDLKAGWLAPFVEGLAQGQAVARACGGCKRVSFPPLRSCGVCGSQDGEWVNLSGRAQIQVRTQGADGDFALVKFEGACGFSAVALKDVSSGAGTAAHITTDGQIMPATDGEGFGLTLLADGTPRLVMKAGTKA